VYLIEDVNKVNNSPRLKKFKKILNDELDNLEFWEVFGKPVTVIKAESLFNLERCQVWDKEEPHSPRFSESALKEYGHIITYEHFLALVDECQILDFGDLNNESITHPAIPHYQPTDGDLLIIRRNNAEEKLKRLRSLLEDELEKFEFWSVEGVLVSFGKSKLPFTVIAWDSEGGRKFPVDSVTRNGTPITYEIFLNYFKGELSKSIASSWSKD
jgi:hypothetical protein